MKRMILIGASLIAFVVLVASGRADGDGSSDGYQVRAIFDNGGFVVNDEEVRVAGATIGTVAEVDITRPGELASTKGDGTAPGKAVIVLQIDDPAFRDFREDATCLIRPQSLLGERYLDCLPTMPRSGASDPPPSLEQIPEGEAGEGQYLLPLENNGKQVDLDLVQNISREPAPDQFRLILNELGVGLAARGDDLAAVIERGNPALQQTDRVLATLAAQNKGLAQLAKDSDTILTPLARERTAVSSFINQAGATAEATAERRTDLEAGFEKFPAALRELRSTMSALKVFANQGAPLVSDLGDAAPGLTGASRALGPFARSATTSLTSLGDAAEASGPDLAASKPVVTDIKNLSKAAGPGAKSLFKLLKTFRERDGIDYLGRFIVKSSGSFNGFDSLSHYLRGILLVTNCTEIVTVATSGCGANFADGITGASGNARVPSLRELLRVAEAENGSVGSKPARSSSNGGVSPSLNGDRGDNGGKGNGQAGAGSSTDDQVPADPDPTVDPPSDTTDEQPATASERRRAAKRSSNNLIDFLFGD